MRGNSWNSLCSLDSSQATVLIRLAISRGYQGQVKMCCAVRRSQTGLLLQWIENGLGTDYMTSVIFNQHTCHVYPPIAKRGIDE